MMERIYIGKLPIQMYITYLLIFFTVSCQNNPVVQTEDDNNIIIESRKFTYEITEETDSSARIDATFEISYYSENSGFQLMEHGPMIWSMGQGTGSVWKYENARDSNIEPHFINAEQKDTLSYNFFSYYRKDDPYTTLKYTLFGIFVDEPIQYDFDSLNTESFYYIYKDTIIYNE